MEDQTGAIPVSQASSITCSIMIFWRSVKSNDFNIFLSDLFQTHRRRLTKTDRHRH